MTVPAPQASHPDPRDPRADSRSEERYRLLMENVQDYAIFLLDPAGRVIEWNTGAQRILGYSEAEILGRSVACIFTPEDLRRGEPERELTTAAAEGRAFDERWHVRKDGTRFWASGVLAPLRDEAGRLRGFAKVLRDLTERKLAEDELCRAKEAAEAANRAKDVLLAMVSHDLRAPLSPILAAAEVLRQRVADETARSMLDLIERSVQVQTQLISDLMDISRIATGKLHLAIGPLDLVPVVEAALESVRPEAAAKGVALHPALEPAGPVAGDPGRLRQVIWNLLSNAIKFTPSGGRVEVRLDRLDGHARLTVSDTGAGIKPELLPHVFEPFRQADHTESRARAGLGLGLAIVHRLVELHGGAVRAESPGEGQGARFTVDLPLAIERARPATAVADSGPCHPPPEPRGVEKPG